MSLNYLIKINKLKIFLIIYFLFIGMSYAEKRLPNIWNIPREMSLFFGREKDLQKISEKLDNGLIILTGVSGIGKTSLAYKYARSNYNRYDIVWKFDSSADLVEQFILFYNKLVLLNPQVSKPNLSKPTDCVDYVKNFLRRTKLTWLLIFDDVCTLDELIGFLPETHGEKKKHIIITGSVKNYVVLLNASNNSSPFFTPIIARNCCSNL